MIGDRGKLVLGGAVIGWQSLEDALAEQPDTPIADERAGIDMLYSSGTTGRPKGVRVALPEDPNPAAPNVLMQLAAGLYGFGRRQHLSQPRADVSRRAVALVDDASTGSAAR